MKYNIWKDCRRVPLPELLDFIVDNRGKTVPTVNQNEACNVVLIATNCIRNENLYPIYEKIRFISEDTYKTWFRSHPIPGDIIFVNKGTPGRVCLCPDIIDFCIAQDMMAFRADSNKLYNKYLLAVLRSRMMQEQIRITSVGDTIPHFKKEFLKDLFIPVPPMGIQRIIGDYYYKLSQKIELNKKINENLEQQAQAIFKSWFVDFEPFGGVMPAEMQMIKLQELCEVVTKGTTPTTLGKSFSNQGINFIKAESILNNHSFDRGRFAYIDGDTNKLLKRSIIKEGDIVFTIAGTLGRFALVDNTILPANTNQAVAIIRANRTKLIPEYLYSFFLGNWHNDYYKKRVQQAVQANLSLSTIKSLPIAMLKNEKLDKYNRLIIPIIKAMKTNEFENQRLANLRDTLLPMLMNGEIDVSQVKI